MFSICRCEKSANMMNFKNKVVLVTGASSGIGAAVSVAFSAAGAKVVTVGRNETNLKAVAAKCKNPLVLIGDVRNDDDVKRIMDQTIKKFGQLDILINNAGLSAPGHLLETDEMMKAYDVVMDTNVRALVHMTSVAAPHLAKTKGNIINISSVSALMAPTFPGTINYYISKAAVTHFGSCAAAELAPHGIRVNTISPGPTQTEFLTNAKINADWELVKTKNALQRISDPSEIAELILFVASDKSKGITGSNFLSDNGLLIKRG
ncbi:3-oxoacyl-[acyl-carrier-protein] reductase FabG-like [Pararge aegeria]|uniref:3-oxoacyl-[acyl-carrier-protein] reductase FabG-like n=1 Tax=Pararge aegeria TaxID=116150 RepID=UPI0019CF6238|nr:3-oxoacyl-[acyl-carrier-protein] reductase FabG-like [Pararge aegeria]